MKEINEYKAEQIQGQYIRLNANESNSIFSKGEIIDMLLSLQLDNFNRYPDTSTKELRKAYGKFIGYSYRNILAGNGSDQLIGVVISSYINKGDKILTLQPDFSMYDFYTSLNEGVVKKYNTENDGSFSVARFIEYGRRVNPNLIIFSNPNNPSGHVISNDEIIFILEAFKDILIVVDEAYYEFYGQGMIGYIEKYKNLIVTRTLSKAWGLAALRIGFLIANKHLINKLRINKTPYNLNTFSQMVGCVVLKHPERILKNVEEIVYERERLYKNLKEIEIKSNKKIEFYKSKANFIFGRSRIKDILKEVFEQNGVLARYFNDDSFRLTVGSPMENDLIVNIIENIINERNLNGEFVDFSDLAKRLDSKDTNKRVIESLIKCGAFDEISENRASLMAGYENVLDSISMDRKKNVQGQISLFDVFGASEENNLQETNTIPKLPEYQEREKLSLEKEVLGMYVSGHPLSEFKEILTKNTSIDNGKLNSLKEDEESYLSLDERDVIMGGMIANKTIKTTKRNDIMAFLDLEDLYGNIEVIVFPQTLKKYNQILNEDSIIFIRGVLNIKEGEEPKIVARDIVDIDNVYQLNRGIYDSKKHINNTENHRKNSKNGLYLKVDSYNNVNMMENISNILKRYPGEENIFLYAEDTKKLYKYKYIFF